MTTKKNKMSDWDKLREFVNSKECGTVITRKDMMEYIYGTRSIKLSTTDTRRRQLIVLGYLSNIQCPKHHNVCRTGMYKITKHIPDDLSSSKLEKLYSDKVKDVNDRFGYCSASCDKCHE